MIYIISFILAFILSAVLTPLVRKLALKYQIGLPAVRKRDVHKQPTPRLGGVAIYLSFYLVIGAILIYHPDYLTFVEEKILNLDLNLLGLFLAGTVWIVAGIYDDTKGLKPFTKLLIQLICGLIIVGFGIKIWWLSNPLGGANLVLGNWTYLLVPIWIVLLMNVLNWFDGIDGLASGVSIISLVVLFLLSLDPVVNQPVTALLCIILAGSTLGFLIFNWYPAKIFLGDSGSMFLGLMIAVFSIISGAKLATAALVLGVPIIDAFWVIISRIKHKKSPFYADRNHLHHRFLDAGFSQQQTVIVIYTICAGFGIIALQTQTQAKIKALLFLLLVMILIAVVLFKLKIRKNKDQK